MTDFCAITVGHEKADLTGNTNFVIQAAIDKAASFGKGVVKILPGRYIMYDSLHLRSGVAVEGSGPDTILWKAPSVFSPLSLYLGYGHFDIAVDHPEKFEVGMGIMVTDDNSHGFYNTVATIIGKHGNELVINRMLNHDYNPARNGRVVSVYPVVSGYYLENGGIFNLTIDGNAAENEYINGCRGGGVFLLQCHNFRIQNITVKNYNGDGISFQQCINTLVEDCLCVDNTGSGLHPGSGSVGAVIRNTTCKNNGKDGIFYCLRVSYSLCEHCTLEGNKGAGISIGHRDTDAIIRDNKVKNNGFHGVYFRKDAYNKTGCRTLLTRNIIVDNCKLKGNGEIFFDSSAEDVVIYDNEGIGKDQALAAKESYLDGVRFDKPEAEEMPIGPEFAKESSVYHLGLHFSKF